MPIADFETLHFSQNWQQQLAQAFTQIESLCDYLQIAINTLDISQQAAQQFALRVPLSFAACIEKGKPDDPLLRQVLPVSEELTLYQGFSSDPVGDLPAAKQQGVIHKYNGRVLLITTGSCAINCRYCFRRNFPYGELQLSKQKQQAAIDYIRNNPSITEVILSGGDPLLLNDERLGQLIAELNSINSVKRIRIHSRLAVVLPARITRGLLKILGESNKQVIMVLHCNHSNELNERVIIACSQLRRYGITLLNQSVLLKGVNDNPQVLADLSENLFRYGVMPYYLHLLDKATGTGHFEVPKLEALAIYQQLQSQLSGYLIPKLVNERAGAAFKELVI
ncbi:MAG: EF-P beta-lysylation protein EpmB [Methylococcaceae bacterium]